jgi:hypothetical protein
MRLFVDAFTLFPQSLFGLAVPNLGALLGVLSPHTHSYTATNNYHIYDGIATQLHMRFNHINLMYS